MNVLETRDVVRAWVEANAVGWPGFQAAHLVGGITSLGDLDPFPASKDVDLHLIFDNSSPMLQTRGPAPAMLEVSVEGIPVEAGLKPVSAYVSPEAILENPELAYHFTVTSSIYDPDGWLSGLSHEVIPRYADRRWVDARLDYQRRGLQSIETMRPVAHQLLGPSGELSLLGYGGTFLAGALSVAALEPPRIGARLFAHIRRHLAARGRLDLYDRLLAILGLDRLSVPQVEELWSETAELFDLAIERKTRFHPFEHKLNAHLRPYLVASTRELIEDGLHREAAGWMLPYYLAATDVLKIDGQPLEQQRATERQNAFLAARGCGVEDERASRFRALEALASEVFSVCESMIAWNPAIRDPARDNTC